MKKILISAIALVVLIAGGWFYVSHKSQVSGASTNVSTIAAAALQVGSGCDNSFSTCTGSTVNQLNVGTCYIKAYATTIAASSSAAVDCQGTAAVSASGLSTLTGVQFGDNVQMTLSTTTVGSTFGGLVLNGAAASTTNGYIVLRIANLTGTTFTWPTTGTATGTAYYVTSR